MSYDLRKGCVICAWRGSCAKKFSIDEGGLHCPDFTEDLELRRKEQSIEKSAQIESEKA